MYGITINMLNIKLSNRNPAIALGNISLGKYTCFIKDEF
jgi:hypothetical protein